MRNIKVVDFTCSKRSSDDVNTNIPFETNYAEAKSIQQANVVIAAYLNKNLGDINKVLSRVYNYNDSEITFNSIIDDYDLGKILFVKDDDNYYVLTNLGETSITFTQLGLTSDISSYNTIIIDNTNAWSKSTSDVDVATLLTNGLMSKESYEDIETLKTNVENISDDIDTIDNSLSNIDDKLLGNKPMGKIVVEDITCKNIFDGYLEQGSYSQSTGEKSTSSTQIRSMNKIKVEPNTNYILSLSTGAISTKPRIFYYSSSAFLNSSSVAADGTFTTGDTVEYITFASADYTISTKFQIEKGSTATTYTPYQIFNYNPYYGIGDTYDGVNAYAGGIGSFLTSSIKTICFDVITPKLLTNITTITVTALRIRCRSIEGTYLLTGSSKYADLITNTDSGGDPLLQTCTGITATKISDNQIRIQASFDSAIYTVNNVPVATEFRNLNMTFE